MTKILPIILLCLASYSHSHKCEETKEVSVQNLIGTWEAENDEFVTTITLNGDLTFSVNVQNDGKGVWVASGEWELTENQLSWHYTESDANYIPAGTKGGPDLVMHIGCGYYSYQLPDGSMHDAKRL